MVDITAAVGSLRLSNPTMLASGIMDEDAGSMLRISDCGAGAIVTKSIGVKARDGYPNPTVVELDYGILNAMGLPNPGIDEFGQEMDRLRTATTPIIGSIYGATAEEFSLLAKKMQQYGASAVELNVSCPHAKRYGLEVGCDPVLLRTITAAVKKSVSIPVFVKISPNVTDIVDIAKAAQKGHADAIVAINTVKAMKIDLETARPILANKTGGYSGKAIKPIGVRCVYEISQHVTIPVIGVGGVTDGEDAIEYIMAGASAVQIGSAVYYRGPEVFRLVCKEMRQWMTAHRYTSLSELQG
ncbi:MAG TPA: dihydroorotate dehydrogenase, partial [Candidatus Thermoplasmatota archaeon]|nr:dihydroorotate dehydrogenase [Candidatus Thermoplasmatota archaeon]